MVVEVDDPGELEDMLNAADYEELLEQKDEEEEEK